VGRALRLTVLAAAPWPYLRTCTSPDLVRAYPRQTVVRLGYVCVYAAVVLLSALFLPWLLLPIGVAAVAGTLVGRRLSSPSYGQSRGLAPGPLALVPVRPFVDQEFAARLFERFGPLVKTSWPPLRGPTLCMKDIPRWAKLVREHDERLGPVENVFDPLIPAGFLRSMSPSDHRVYQKVFQQAFSDDVVEACRPHFADCVRAGLGEMAIASGRTTRGIDPRPSLRRLTEAAFIRLFFGLLPGTDDYEFFRRAYEEMGFFVELRSPKSGRGRRLQAVAGEIDAVIRERSAEIVSAIERGERPQASFLAAILRARPDAGGDANITLNLVFLLRTASSDVTGLLHWIVKKLVENPVWIERLRDGDEDLPRRIVLETLRLEQSEYVYRRVLEPIAEDGFVVPACWNLRLCVHEAHRDPEIFPNPAAFDPDRFLARHYSSYEYQPFGRLRHRCLGGVTTEALAGAFVSQLASYEWAVVADGPAVFDKYHWRPSRRFRMTLTPNAEATSQQRTGARPAGRAPVG
jgi:cytochrome P450